MSLREYLDDIDQTLEEADLETLRKAIHNYARLLQDYRKNSFMDFLKQSIKPIKKEAKELSEKKINILFNDLQKSLNYLDRIDNDHAITIKKLCELPPSDPFYLPEEYEFDLGNVSYTIRELIMNGFFESGIELYDKLIDTRFIVESESGRKIERRNTMIHYFPPINRKEINIEKNLFDALLYAYYITKPMSVRMPYIYLLIRHLNYPWFKFEDLLKYKEDFEDFEEFLDEAIEFLKFWDGEGIVPLLYDAICTKYYKKLAPDLILDAAQTHPEVILEMMYNEKLELREKMELGVKTLEKLDLDPEIRSSIAVLTACCANGLEMTEIANEYLYQFFSAKPTPENYLQAIYDSNDPVKLNKRLKEVIDTLEIQTEEDAEMTMLLPSDEESLILKLLTTNCDDFFVRSQTDEFFSWSFDFIKESIALLLVLLDSKEADEHDQNIKDLVIKALHKKSCSYSIKQWKTLLGHIDNDTAKKYCEELEKLLKRHVGAIVDNNRDQYYKECATMIATLFDIEEKLGIAGAKERLLDDYVSTYSDKTGFVFSLKSAINNTKNSERK